MDSPAKSDYSPKYNIFVVLFVITVGKLDIWIVIVRFGPPFRHPGRVKSVSGQRKGPFQDRRLWGAVFKGHFNAIE